MAADHQPCNLKPNEQFADLLAANQRGLYLFIRTLIRDSEDAEEILSNTNLVLWGKSDEFLPGSNFRAWAFQVARYEVLGFRKIKRRRLSKSWIGLSDEILDVVARTFVENADRLDARRAALNECLEKLGERDRDLVDRRNRPQATIAKIAQDVGRPVEGLYKAFQRIYRVLGECIDRAMARDQKYER